MCKDPGRSIIDYEKKKKKIYLLKRDLKLKTVINLNYS